MRNCSKVFKTEKMVVRVWEMVSKSDVKSVREQFWYGPEISYYLNDSRPDRHWIGTFKYDKFENS